MRKTFFLPIFICLSCFFISADFVTTPDSPIYITKQKKPEYKAYENGDRVPDFSFCGYKASEETIPAVAVKVTVPAKEGDATARIQKALDYVASLPLDADGFRGAVLLEKGRYEIDGSLTIRASGVVLRGSGSNANGTVLFATGNGRETLIRIAGVNNRVVGPKTPIKNEYVPVNATVLPLADPHNFKKGDKIIVNRPSTEEWLRALGTDRLGNEMQYNFVKWLPGDFDIDWDRTITDVTPTSVTIDVPLTGSLDPAYGGGSIAKYTWNGRIRNTGVENLRCISAYDESNPKDENHRWMTVTMDNAEDSWVRRVVAMHFASSAVAVWETCKRITVEDCKSLAPVSEIGNFRRYSFHTLGQQILFQRCYAELGYHDFSVGFNTPGPNAFVQCWSHLPFNFSGAVGGWATGVLFDKTTVEGGNLSYNYRDMDAQGAGWCAANSLFWQCRASQIHCAKPPTAQNYAYGSWTQPYGNGHYELSHTFTEPESFYYAQLEARTGKTSPETEKIYVYDTKGGNAPNTEYVARMNELSKHPDMTGDRWIDMMIDKYPLFTEKTAAKSIDEIRFSAPTKPPVKSPEFAVKNGKIVRGNRLMAYGRIRSSLWRGSTRRHDREMSPGQLMRLSGPPANLTRFVPGREGRGLTDNIDTLVADMCRENYTVFSHFPALWYERRRDDHERNKRADADVWAPFYEQPFSRSGTGEAYDRLSKYDLNKFNPWYWSRLKTFADKADRNGLILIQEHYLQHNIIEEGAHWVDYPWRSANNINNLGFAENTRFAGDRRVFMAEEFYDTSVPVRAEYHKKYIRQSIDNFEGNNGVIHSLGAEYTGPEHFVKFWLDVIRERENETHKNVSVSLGATKDVQDAVLADPEYGKVVDIIEIGKWHYRADGSLYAPKGGISLAPRQNARLEDPGTTSFEQVYRAVSEYKKKYPEKAVIYSSPVDKAESRWAVFMAGGSLPQIPKVSDPHFLEDAASCHIIDAGNASEKQYILGNPGTGYIVYNDSGKFIVDLTGDKKTYIIRYIDPRTGNISNAGRVKGGKVITQTAPDNRKIAWLSLK